MVSGDLLKNTSKATFSLLRNRLDDLSFKGLKNNFMYSKRICRSRGSGSYGEYFQYNPHIGIKAFNDMKEYWFQNILYKKNTKAYKQLFREAALINLFYGKRIAKIAILYEWDIKEGITGYIPSIVMPHFCGKNPGDLQKLNYDPAKDAVKRSPSCIPLVFAIQAYGHFKGIYFHDLHSGNLIIDKLKRPWVVDFTPEHIQYTGSTSRLEKEIDRLKSKFISELKCRVKNSN